MLPPRNASDDEVKAWVRAALADLDTTPKQRYWRFNASGGSLGQVVAEAVERQTRLSVRVPVREARMVTAAAKSRGFARDTYMRRVLGTWLVAIDDVDPASLVTMLRGGMITP